MIDNLTVAENAIQLSESESLSEVLEQESRRYSRPLDEEQEARLK